MIDYAAQYYILRKPTEDSAPFLVPDEDTVDRTLGYEAQPVGSPPLIFSNAWKERNLSKKIKEVVTPILFHANDLVVSTPIREALLYLKLPHVHMHPAIYIDDRDTWHEDYWYVTFSKLFDCWDRESSDTSKNFVESDGERRYDVYEYVLNEALLDATPLEERLLFQMGGTITAFVFCHESIVKLFRRDGPIGARLVLASEY
jgi:hypothetical protein